ncbi:MAG: ABC transporter ATP-binding protein [Bacillota bacterium]
MKHVLEVKNLSVDFRMYQKGLKKQTTQTIKNIDLTIDSGEIVAIIGSSGSGKSLLAHAILGILPSNAIVSGEIFYQGSQITDKSILQLRGKEIALVPQSINYFDPLMRVGKQVRNKTVTKARQREAFARYGLTISDEALYPFQYSGGMAKRALLSTAVASGATLIIADEPTPGLSHDLGMEVMANFKELADEGKSILMITHDIDLAGQFADRIYVFHEGMRIDEIASRDFREGNLTHPYTKALFSALPQNGFHLPEAETFQFLENINPLMKYPQK